MDLSQIQEILSIVCQGGMALVVLATLIVRITPSKSDDQKLAKFYQSIHKIIAFLPTFGVNPRTKQLQEWYEENKPKEKV